MSGNIVADPTGTVRYGLQLRVENGRLLRQGGRVMKTADAISAAIHRMVASINEADMEAALAAFAENAVIIEDIPPYRWDGPGAVMNWLQAMGANAQRLGVTKIAMTLTAAIRTDINDDRAYSIQSGRLTLATVDGEMTAEGQLTVILVARDQGWLVDSLVWSGPQPG